MKIFLYTDTHWSQYSSILRRRGQKYSVRLEGLIQSINWAEALSQELECDAVGMLGDFFDTPIIGSEELTALADIKWNKGVPHIFLVGNHESNVSSLVYNSTKALDREGFTIVSKPDIWEIDDKTVIILLPYIIEEERKTLKEYIKELLPNHSYTNVVVFSHNDIKGIKYGAFESKEGFDLEDIENNSNLFLNGHLHNTAYLNKNKTILNLGNLTGQNFSENAFKHRHFAYVFDTDTNEITRYENPYAFNFYKVEIKDEKDLKILATLGDNSVVSIKSEEKIVDKVWNKLKKMSHIIDSRVTVYRESQETNKDVVISLQGMDYIKKFADYMVDTLGSSDILEEELAHISRGT